MDEQFGRKPIGRPNDSDKSVTKNAVKQWIKIVYSYHLYIYISRYQSLDIK
jgi:hypothetical protein